MTGLTAQINGSTPMPCTVEITQGGTWSVGVEADLLADRVIRHEEKVSVVIRGRDGTRFGVAGFYSYEPVGVSGCLTCLQGVGPLREMADGVSEDPGAAWLYRWNRQIEQLAWMVERNEIDIAEAGRRLRQFGRSTTDDADLEQDLAERTVTSYVENLHRMDHIRLRDPRTPPNRSRQQP